MNKMKHAMIDIETLGTGPKSVVLTIGCCKFSPFDSEAPTDILSLKLDVDDQDKKGRIVNQSTLDWWGTQAPAIRDEAFSMHDRIPTVDALHKLNEWMRGTSKVWSQGPSFDMSIMSSLYDDFEMKKGWNFWDERDARTITALMSGDYKRNVLKNAHSAVEDAIAQAKCVQESFRVNNLKFLI